MSQCEDKLIAHMKELLVADERWNWVECGMLDHVWKCAARRQNTRLAA